MRDSASQSEVFALFDCKSFYASSQIAFDPGLHRKAVVVLSKNDGCAISLNDDAKRLGIERGDPYFEFEEKIKQVQGTTFSINPELYGDVSERVMNTLKAATPEVEVDSIDEIFLGLNQTNRSFEYVGRELQEKVYKWTGIPTGVGLAGNKTLSKLANRLAKTSTKANGLVNLYQSPFLDVALERTPIGKVWNIGNRTAAELLKINVKTALQFKHCNLKWARKKFTVVGSRTLLELNGIRCYPIEVTNSLKRTIARTGSFGELISGKREVYNAVSWHLMSAFRYLRENNLVARGLTVFIETNRFSRETFYGNSYTYKSVYPSDNLFEIQEWAEICFGKIFREQTAYKKAGVILTGLMPREGVTGRLYQEERVAERFERLNRAIDEINRRFGNHTVRLGSAQKGQWMPKENMRSPRYTTRFEEIIRVK